MCDKGVSGAIRGGTEGNSRDDRDFTEGKMMGGSASVGVSCNNCAYVFSIMLNT